MATASRRTCREHDGMWPPKLRPSRSIGIYGISNIFQQRPSAILNFKNCNIWSRDCHCCPNLLLYTKFQLNWFTPPDAYNCMLNVQCAVATQRPLPWQPHYGEHVGNVMGCDQSSFVPIGPLLGELWYFQYFRTWRPSAILNFKNFNIWLCECHCGPNLLLYTEFYQNWLTCSASRRP